MALVHVRFKDGTESVVGDRWLTRWPEDFAPVGEEQPAVEAEPATSPTGDNKKEK